MDTNNQIEIYFSKVKFCIYLVACLIMSLFFVFLAVDLLMLNKVPTVGIVSVSLIYIAIAVIIMIYGADWYILHIKKPAMIINSKGIECICVEHKNGIFISWDEMVHVESYHVRREFSDRLLIHFKKGIEKNFINVPYKYFRGYDLDEIKMVICSLFDSYYKNKQMEKYEKSQKRQINGK